MAPIPSDDESERGASSVSGSEVEEHTSRASGLPPAMLEGDEEEFHTEDSDASDDNLGAASEEQEGEEDMSDLDALPDAAAVPPLPEHLLKHTSAQPPARSLADVPWDRLTSKQKKARRNNSRKAKKRAYDELMKVARGTGVLEAGKAAQKQRGIAPVRKERVRNGRVQKRGREKVEMSGKQRMIEQRKRVVAAAASGEMGGRAKRARSGRG